MEVDFAVSIFSQPNGKQTMKEFAQVSAPQPHCCAKPRVFLQADGGEAKGPQSGTWEESSGEIFYTALPSLLARLKLSRDDFPFEKPTEPDAFPLLVPESFVARMIPGDPGDPLLRQVLPTDLEKVCSPGYSRDPVLEQALIARSPLIRKYEGRALLLTTPRCAIHCRFCFRRYRTFPEVLGNTANEEEILRALQEDGTIREVILSGGDPLVLEDEVFDRFLKRLVKIPTVRRIRIHTRVPVALPQRVSQQFVQILQSVDRPTVLVLHVNHPQELTPPVVEVISRLVDGGILVLSQTVLLRSINDRAEVLTKLFEMLIDLRVLPYYLHQLDPVEGASHFEVPIEVGREIVAVLRAKLPGYAVPRYVREVPGLPAKEVLA
jgi:EF-P beta-lysylation protein EpmB